MRALAVAAPPSKSLPSMTDGRTGGREERETAQSNVTIQNVNQSSLRISNRERILERERERERIAGPSTAPRSQDQRCVSPLRGILRAALAFENWQP